MNFALNAQSGLSFLIGVLVGFVCVGGLSLGFKIVAEAMADETLPNRKKNWRVLWGALILAGQLFVAFGILYKSELRKEYPVPLALGLVVSILIFSTAVGRFLKDKD